MMAQSLAERFRRARENFVLAQQLHCTPKEAEAEIARRDARARWEQTRARLDAKRRAPLARAADPAPAERSDPSDRWMMRD